MAASKRADSNQCLQNRHISCVVGYEFGHHLTATNSMMQGAYKPKRIRTAFSPSQLVQLEAAFDNNPYVVGQERRDLASQLNLTETQVSGSEVN